MLLGLSQIIRRVIEVTAVGISGASQEMLSREFPETPETFEIYKSMLRNEVVDFSDYALDIGFARPIAFSMTPSAGDRVRAGGVAVPQPWRGV